jgi:transposase
MIDFLEHHHVPFNPSLKKADLMEAITRFVTENGGKSAFTKYSIDEHFKNNDISILRLPPYNCELSSIELFWSHLKHLVRKESCYVYN